MLRRLILSLALTVLFALGQQGAAVHEISHYADLLPTHQQQDKAPHGAVCDQCLSYGKLASAVGVSSFVQPASIAQFALYAPLSASDASQTFLPYSARAPPRLA